MATCSDSEHSINQERKIKINKKLTLIGFDDLGIEENNFPIDSKELLKTILKKYGREY